MAEVQLLVPRSGLDGSFAAGDRIHVSAAEAERMVAAGQALLVGEDAADAALDRSGPEPEKAVRRSKAERAVR